MTQIIGQYCGRAVSAREVTALDEAGDDHCWIRLDRFGDTWLLIQADPREVVRKVRKVRGIPMDAESERFPLAE